ncbi:MAG: hypothetical protein JWP01_1000 [Myxococcales bacterium]|nr:hypothetical protein [Myxococcales bacterium]
MKAALFVIAVAVIVQLVGETASAAYQLEPISRVFAPSGSQATQSFEVVNPGPERVALTISFATLERDEAYAESNHDADDNFLAYPSQLVLAAGARQTVRVTWLGTATPTRELTFRIIVTQVPIEALDPTAAPDVQPVGQVRVLLNYRGTVFIRPPKATPKVSPSGAVLVMDKDRHALLSLTLANSGTAMGLVTSCSVRIAPAHGGPEEVVPAASLAPLHHTRILAGDKRRYLVAWPSDLEVGPVKVSGRCSVEP